MSQKPPALAGRRGGGGSSGGAARRGDGFKIYFVVNPVSGHRLGEAYWNKIQPLFRAAKVEFDSTLTSHSGHATGALEALLRL